MVVENEPKTKPVLVTAMQAPPFSYTILKNIVDYFLQIP
jgi:hypothetical protein